MPKMVKVLTISTLVFLVVGYMLKKIDEEAKAIHINRQREVIHKLRDSLYAERNRLFHIDGNTPAIYTFITQNKKGDKTSYSLQIANNSVLNSENPNFSALEREGITLMNPNDNTVFLPQNKISFQAAKHIISYNRQGDFVLDDSKLVGFVSKKIYNALTNSESIKIQLNDMPEGELIPMHPETPYNDYFFDNIEFKNDGSVVLPPINYNLFPLNIKVGNKKGMPQVIKANYKIDENNSVLVWVLNNPDFPLILKMDNVDNFELKEILKP